MSSTLHQNWEQLTLGDLGRVVTGRTPPSSKPELFGDQYPFITPTDMAFSDRSIRPERGISDAGAESLSRIKLPAKTPCFVCIGATIGKLCLTSEESFTNQQINSIVVNKDRHNPDFVYYLLRHVSGQVKSLAGGAATPIINKSAFSEVPVRVPSLEVQGSIASILSTYDDLIENNTRRIEILEEMARRLYEEWFVHFRFPGHEEVSFKESELGEIPEGWEVCKLIDLVDFIGGAQPPKSQHIYEAKEGYVRFVQNRDYRSDGHLTYIPESKRNKICGRLDILVDKYGEAGKARFGIAGAYNVALAKIVPKNESYREWLRGFLSMTQTQEYLLGASQAATRPSLNKAHFNFPVVRPSESVAERFGHQVLPMLKLMLALKDKTANLRAQRDLLLPKLVSGEIDVSDISMPDDKEVEAA